MPAVRAPARPARPVSARLTGSPTFFVTGIARRSVGGVPKRYGGVTPPGTYTLTAFCATCGRDMPHVSSTAAAYSYRCRRCGRQRGTAVSEYVAASGRQPLPADPVWLAEHSPGTTCVPLVIGGPIGLIRSVDRLGADRLSASSGSFPCRGRVEFGRVQHGSDPLREGHSRRVPLAGVADCSGSVRPVVPCVGPGRRSRRPPVTRRQSAAVEFSMAQRNAPQGAGHLRSAAVRRQEQEATVPAAGSDVTPNGAQAASWPGYPDRAGRRGASFGDPGTGGGGADDRFS